MTISKIAKLANVSTATVDRVLHQRGRVSAETTDLVLNIVKKYGFEPNQYARNLKLNRKYKFGVLLKSFEKGSDSYWEQLYDGCISAAKELNSLSGELVFGFFEDTEEESLYQVGKKLMEQNISGLVLAPNSPEDVDLLLTEIGDTPYAFVNTNHEKASPIIDTSQDCEIAGETAARIIEMLKPNGRVFATIRRESSSNSTIRRTKSFCNYFANRKGIKITNYIINHSEDIKKQIENFMIDYSSIEGLFVVNTSTSLYVDYMKQIIPSFRPAVIGYDVTPGNIKLLENNDIDCIISQQPFSQGYNAVQQMYLHQILGNKEQIQKRAPVTVLFKENYKSYLATIHERY